jgi:branched-chain amino acid aminotransferase
MTMKADWIWMNGELIPWEQATVHVFTHALHYGTSVFEGIRAYNTPNGPAIFRSHEHFQRLLDSAKVMHIDVAYSVDELIEATKGVIRANKQESCYIRPLAYRGYETLGVDGRKCPSEIIIGSVPWGAYLGEEAINQGVDVMVSSWRRTPSGVGAPMAKIGGQYINSQFIAMEAHDLGYDEAISLDIHGYVAEGSGENLFLIKDGMIYTPPLASSILSGITRASIHTIARDLGYEVKEMTITREMLYLADELFFTGTAAEVTPICSVDRLPIGSGTRGPITQAIQQRFFNIVAGRHPDEHGWLDYVYDQA